MANRGNILNMQRIAMKATLILLILGVLGLLIFGCLPKAPRQDFPQEPAAVIEALKSPDQERRLEALVAIRRQAVLLENDTIFPLVLSKLAITDDTERGAAELIVESCREVMLPRLEPYLKSSKFEDYLRAAAAIRIIGQPAAIYADIVGDNLKNSLAKNLGPANKEPPTDEAVVALSREQQQEFKRRLASLWAIEAMGPNVCRVYAATAMSVIQREFEPGADFNLKVAALRILGVLGSEAQSYLPELIDLLDRGGDNLSVRSQLLMTLGSIGSSPEIDVVEKLSEHLTAGQYKERLSALEGLARLGPAAKSTAGRLKELMNDKNLGVYGQAAYTYFRVTGELDPAIPVLKAALENPSKEHEILEIIGRLGRAGEPLTDTLVRKLSSPDTFTREYAVIALKNIGVDSSDVISELRRIASSDPDLFVREHANVALQQLQQK